MPDSLQPPSAADRAADRAAIAPNIAASKAMLELAGKLGLGTDQAVMAMLTAVTVIIEVTNRPDQRLETLNGFLAPTIEDWLADRRQVSVQ